MVQIFDSTNTSNLLSIKSPKFSSSVLKVKLNTYQIDLTFCGQIQASSSEVQLFSNTTTSLHNPHHRIVSDWTSNLHPQIKPFTYIWKHPLISDFSCLIYFSNDFLFGPPFDEPLHNDNPQ